MSNPILDPERFETNILRNDVHEIYIITKGITFECGGLLHDINVDAEFIREEIEGNSFSKREVPVHRFHVTVPFDLYDEKNNDLLYISGMTKKALYHREQPPVVDLSIHSKNGYYYFLNGLISEEHLEHGEDYFLKFVFEEFRTGELGE